MIHWHLEKSLGGAGFAVWRGPLVSRPPPDRGVLIPIQVSPSLYPLTASSRGRAPRDSTAPFLRLQPL